MNGRIDAHGRALVEVVIEPTASAKTAPLEVWIDTGFNGDLVLPRTHIETLGLQKSGSVDAILADGSPIELTTYTCFIN